MAKTDFFKGLDVPGSNGTLPVPPQLLHKDTTTVNQILGLPGMFSTFEYRDLRNLRILALTSSSLSIVSCAVSIFFLLNIDRRRRMFRHDLVLFLFICDLVKAIVLMIYPLVILLRNDVYSRPEFFNTLGWFTAYCVEGADLAIFFFAIHFALLIFKPSWKWRNKRSRNVEGGLYQFRAFIWPITALAPLILASLAFVNFKFINMQYLVDNTTVVLDNNNYHFGDFPKLGGYKPYSAWCYLPPFPLWYKLVLSWGPRYFLIVVIFVLYLAIYIFVRRQSSRIKNQIHDFKHKHEEEDEKRNIKTTSGLILWFLKRYTIYPIISFFGNLVSFFSFSLEDTADSSRGRSMPSSICSFRADDSSSYRQTQSSGINGDYDFFESRGNENSMDLSSLLYANEARRASVLSGTLRGLNNLSNPEKNIISERARNSNAISFNDKTTTLHNEDSNMLSTSSPKKRLNNGNAGQSLTDNQQNFLSEIEQTENKGYNKDLMVNKQGTNAFDEVQADFQKQTYAEMKKRRIQIQRNLRSIFVYPFSYIAIWIFPLIVDATQYRYEPVHGPIVWLVYLATIAQPLNGFVDTVVFLYREKPWKYSWREIQSRELMDQFTAKGEMDERDIHELYNSDLGKRGWYYCGRFKKKECWHHKPQKWKRIAWYLYRFLFGIFRNHVSFEDNCDDTSYWSKYYLLDKNIARYNGSKTPARERQLSFPSDSTTTSDSFINGLSYVEIPLLWKIIHKFSMLKGIDLDDVNRLLRLKNTNDEFTLITNQKTQTNVNIPNYNTNKNDIFKPNYSLVCSMPTANVRSQFDIPESTDNRLVNEGSNLETNFNDVVRDLRQYSDHGHREQNEANDNDIDMLAFLKGTNSMA